MAPAIILGGAIGKKYFFLFFNFPKNFNFNLNSKINDK
jgi:hypothetical protein